VAGFRFLVPDFRFAAPGFSFLMAGLDFVQPPCMACRASDLSVLAQGRRAAVTEKGA
jgi:hypothetical protein